ncbi:hypothetical protein M3Y94_00133000 [Aphelenchoides besseyi]|nr:hypothetical protein M3Y94_00133000 [Aphelenchoides besseyi]
MSCVGRKLFVCHSSPHAKKGLLSLDLDTRKWNMNFPLNDYDYMYGIGEQALIVATKWDNGKFLDNGNFLDIHRYVFNHPDKLSDLIWLQLKRIFDARPEAYELILSRLTFNFKQKCPFSQF